MLTVYTGHTKSGLRTKLGRLRLQYIFCGSDQFFLLYFCAWNQRNYDTSCRRNQETGVDHFFWRGVRGFEPDVMIPNKNQEKTKQNTRPQDLKQHHTLRLHRQKCQVRTPFLTVPCPIFLSRKRAFISFCFS